MTRAEILTQVRKLLSDEETPYLWKEEEMNFYYDMAVKQLCSETGIFTKTVDNLTTVANQYLYDIPESIFDVESIFVNDVLLKKVPYEFIKSLVGQTGDVCYYCLDFIDGKFLLHPTPSQNGLPIKVIGSAIPEGAEIDTAVPSKYSHFLIYGVMAMAFDKTDSEAVAQLSVKYEQKWRLGIERIKKDLTRLKHNYINVTLKHPGLL